MTEDQWGFKPSTVYGMSGTILWEQVFIIKGYIM
jgi:hypothetical protein